MKRIAYSFLLIALMSCGTSSHLIGNKIRVQFRDSTSAEYRLIAVRDSSILVMTEYPNEEKIFAFSKIDRIYHNIDGKSFGTAFGGLLGCAVGVTGSYVLLPPSGDGYEALGRAIIIIPSLIAGSAIGCAVSNDEKGFDLQDPIDRLSVKQFSQFPFGEPGK